jgi:hypothetical protein
MEKVILPAGKLIMTGQGKVEFSIADQGQIDENQQPRSSELLPDLLLTQNLPEPETEPKEAEEGQEEAKINLPPIPEGAVEFGRPQERPVSTPREVPGSLGLLGMLSEVLEDQGSVEVQEDLKDPRIGLNEAVDNSIKEINRIEDDRLLAIMQNIAVPIDDDKITNDPTPTPADQSKAFHDVIQAGLVDLDDEGGVKPVTSNTVNILDDTKLITIPDGVFDGVLGLGANKSQFSPGTVQNALRDNDTEGGIVSNKSASMMRSDDPAKDGGQMKLSSVLDENENKFRLYGFTVQYSDGSKVVTRNVSDFFDDLESATVSINGAKYLMPMANGFKVVDIVSGVPIVSHSEQAIYQHINSEWKRV